MEKEYTLSPQKLENDAHTAIFSDRFGVSSRTSNCGRFAQLLRPPRQPIVDVSDAPILTRIDAMSFLAKGADRQRMSAVATV